MLSANIYAKLISSLITLTSTGQHTYLPALLSYFKATPSPKLPHTHGPQPPVCTSSLFFPVQPDNCDAISTRMTKVHSPLFNTAPSGILSTFFSLKIKHLILYHILFGPLVLVFWFLFNVI